MEDPLSSVHDRPHRYLLDSDSEDEEGQGIYYTESGPSSSRLSKIKISTALPEPITISGTHESYDEIILGIGQAGKYLLRKLGGEGVEVKVGDEVVGSGGVEGGRFVLWVDDRLVGDIHSLAEELLKLQTRSWIITSIYLPSMYIPDRPFSLPTAPIRALSLKDGQRVERKLDGIENITSPNYVTGLAAALLSRLIHPTSAKLDASLILLPLPISSMSDQLLIKSLSQLSAAGDIRLSPKSKAWTESDDEPFAQAGMGAGKNKGGKKADVKREIDGMYM